MSTLSSYWFPGRLFAGPFEGFNLPFPTGGAAFVYRPSSSASSITFCRPDNEFHLPLGPFVNSPDAQTEIDKLLGGNPTRTSDILAQGLFWFECPYYGEDPARHNDSDMLVRIYFNMHISTPSYCWDADGSIEFFVLFFLDTSGHLQAFVDGWGWQYTKGGPDVCGSHITDDLNNRVPGATPQVQALLNQFTKALGGLTSSWIYLLPGSGKTTSGDFTDENADTDVALALIP